jgi:hypothetical protein
MHHVKAVPIPADALLARYVASGDFADCYTVTVPGTVSLADFMSAFYTTPIFKVERWLLARFLNHPSTDDDARRLAQGQLTRFSAWNIESRQASQALLAAGRTRSWFMVSQRSTPPGTTALIFGSAVLQRKHGGMGWAFHALSGFHKLYSHVLLASAVRSLSQSRA